MLGRKFSVSSLNQMQDKRNDLHQGGGATMFWRVQFTKPDQGNFIQGTRV